MSTGAVMKRCMLGCFLLLGMAADGWGAEPSVVLDLWRGQPPGEVRKVGPEQDMTRPEDALIAGRRIIKLGNVSTPQIHVFLPPKDKRNGTAVVICPGGGFHILAWDLEGTEVAEWLNSLGIVAVVLKYRVPTAQQTTPWQAPVQDAQRALSMTRSKAAEWGVAVDRIGVLGFSAGGFTAAHVAVINNKRAYEAGDDADKVPYRPDFAVLVYPAYLVDDKTNQLKPDFAVTRETPPLFFIHAADDKVRCDNSVQLFLALTKAGGSGELHVYDAGGHGYGLRPQTKFPVTTWPRRCEEWLGKHGWLKAAP